MNQYYQASCKLTWLLVVCLFGSALESHAEPTFDIVLQGGHLIDPESSLSAVRNVGIRDGRIESIAQGPLSGKETIDVSGYVVAPGFIDLHSHTPTPLGQQFQALDGVTTALELEAGAYPLDSLKAYLAPSGALINFGASVGHLFVRMRVMDEVDIPDMQAIATLTKPVTAFTEPATDHQLEEISRHLEQGLNAGGLGIGLLLDYISEAVDEHEVDAIFSIAAAHRAPVFVHIRRGLPGDATGLDEMIAAARRHDAPVHICHINASAISGIENFLEKVDQARSEGVDITAGSYPYNAGSTSLSAAVFSRDWQSIFGITYEDVEWAATGQRFDEAMWHEYREKHPNGNIIHHYGRETWTRTALLSKAMIIESDAMPLVTPDQKVHPRGVGTFSRFLKNYVGVDGLTFEEAVARITLLPAERLATVAPSFTNKGRIQIGADADITVFDAEDIKDNATYRSPLKASTGIALVMVNGDVIVRNGEIVKDVYPGKLVTEL